MENNDFFPQQVNTHLLTLQTCLTTLMGHPISMEQLRLDVGHMVEKMTQITIMFRRIKLRMEEYVCLKVYILLNQGIKPQPKSQFQYIFTDEFLFAEHELEGIQERYVQVLRSYLQHTSPNNPGRLGELLAHIPEVRHTFCKENKKLSNVYWNSYIVFFGIHILPLSLTQINKFSAFFSFIQIQAAASLLLESKMFYVPFVLNSASVR